MMHYMRTNNAFHQAKEIRARDILMSGIPAYLSKTTGVKGITHKMIAEELGVHHDTVARVFSGNPIGAPTMKKIFEWEDKHK
jgi:hypothetical protein